MLSGAKLREVTMGREISPPVNELHLPPAPLSSVHEAPQIEETVPKPAEETKLEFGQLSFF